MQSRKNIRPIWYFVVLSIILLALVLFYIKAHAKLSSGKMAAYGTLGDYFGGISNPILAFITFTAVLFTVYLQLKQSHESQKLNFEGTFFNMLTLFVTTRSKLKYKEFEGEECFEKIIEDKFLTNKKFSNSSPLIESTKRDFTAKDYSTESAKKKYTNFNKTHNQYLGHYFRTLYRVLKIIDGSNLDIRDKISYSRILRAQLSTDELSLLFLNGLKDVCDQGNFQKLIYRYSMLEHLSVGDSQHPPLDIDQDNYMDVKFFIGEKILVEGFDIKSYLLRDGAHYRNTKPLGAFGKNPSPLLKKISDYSMK
ncbi:MULTISPECIES: putative phage abortive infection protein [unclassified Pantoea]|uniref:putative phage abortive infection protein n=1 Tax=unclassified Pantoea TaxID=2630326 RepID=UPI00226A5998|nr:MULTISPECIES: putative phage abortive infection protein [unclassified Pantoea]